MQALSPTPPERGSFPQDHDGECTKYMQAYLECIRLVKGENGAINCRVKARAYLKCRMDHKLMEQDSFKNLGLPEPTTSGGATAGADTATATATFGGKQK